MNRDDEWYDRVYYEIVERLGKPITTTSNNRLLYNCPICKKPKFYLYPYVGWCHYCGKSFLLKDLMALLGIEPKKKFDLSDRIKNKIHNMKNRDDEFIQPEDIDSVELIDFIYRNLFVNRQPYDWRMKKLQEWVEEGHIGKEYNQILEQFKNRHIFIYDKNEFPTAGDTVKIDAKFDNNRIWTKYYNDCIIKGRKIPGVKRINAASGVLDSIEFNLSDNAIIFLYYTEIDNVYYIIGYNARLLNKKKNKYRSAHGLKKRLFIPYGFSLSDVSIITEGEKKALLFSSLLDIPTVAVSGVYCFKTPEFAKYKTKDQRIIILYDNVEINRNTERAENQLCSYLKEIGFSPVPIHFPGQVDDYLLEVGSGSFLEEMCNKYEERSKLEFSRI